MLVGIIPACAGNIGNCPAGLRSVRDHPRVCGEHRELPLMPYVIVGSSPRVRGTYRRPKASKTHWGIIPACAGNIWWRTANISSAQDHPRVCGEHFNSSRISCGIRGSSPRVRGTYLTFSLPHHRLGIIPACAGNISKGSKGLPANRDHPRVCGEHCY